MSTHSPGHDFHPSRDRGPAPAPPSRESDRCGEPYATASENDLHVTRAARQGYKRHSHREDLRLRAGVAMVNIGTFGIDYLDLVLNNPS